MPRRMHQPLARALAAEGCTWSPSTCSATAAPTGPPTRSLLDDRVRRAGRRAARPPRRRGARSSAARRWRQRLARGRRPAPERVRGLISRCRCSTTRSRPGSSPSRRCSSSPASCPGGHRGRRADPRRPARLVPFWVGIGLDTLDQQPAADGGRCTGSSSAGRAVVAAPQRSTPTIVVGHPATRSTRPPTPPCSPRSCERQIHRGRHRRAAGGPERLDREARSSRLAAGTAARPARTAPSRRPQQPGAAGHNGLGVNLYRDEAVVLRTQKLGEADRSSRCLTRQHGGCARSPRAYAAPRRRWAHGSSRSPTSTCSSPRAATSTWSRRPRRSARSGRVGLDYERYTAGT